MTRLVSTVGLWVTLSSFTFDQKSTEVRDQVVDGLSQSNAVDQSVRRVD